MRPAASARVLRELKPLLHLDCMTVTGETLGERCRAPHRWVDRAVVRRAERSDTRDRAAWSRCSATWRPNGAIIKRSAADPRLFEREGRAVVFDSLEDLAARIDDPGPGSDCGRFPGAAERRTERRLRHARGRLSADPGKARARRGEGHGAHFRCAHERHRLRHHRAACLARSRIGGPLALVRNGDRIRLSMSGRRLDLLVDERELAKRRLAHRPMAMHAGRGYARLYMQSVLQAEAGCDFDFLRKL